MANDEDVEVKSTISDENGNYSLSNLNAGYYKIKFEYDTPWEETLEMWYPQKSGFNTAHSVLVRDGYMSTTIDAEFEIYGSISGTVKNLNGTTLAGVTVEIHNSVDPAQEGTYTVRYNVMDAYSNHAEEVLRTVHIVRPTFKATPLIQMGIRPGGDDAGLFIGLDEVLGFDGNPLENFKLSGYQIEITYDPTNVSPLEAVDIDQLGQFDQNSPTTGKVLVLDASEMSSERIDQLFFLPLVLKGTALDPTSLEIDFAMIRDETLKIVKVPISELTFVRGKILNEGELSPNVGDAIAGLQYLAKLRPTSFDDMQVNLVNMASIVGDTGIAVPDIKDIIAIMQYLVQKRDASFNIVNSFSFS